MQRGGALIGRYRVVQLLGHGGMGDVYLATAHGAAGFEKPVVLKMLRPHGRPVVDLLREAFIGVGLDHPNVVQVLDLCEHEGRYYLVMEYVRGFTLAHVLDHARASGPALPAAVVSHVIGAVADALEYVHGLGTGLIHRDVSPSNVLLGVDGRIKLSDFGVAVLDQEARGDAVVGKPAYLPPECFLGARPTQAWDVYALGVMLWEALAGARPFPGTSLAEVRASVLAGPAPLVPADPAYPAELLAVARRAISSDPARRFASAGELRQALVAACAPDGGEHRRLVRATFAAPAFVARFGDVPDPRLFLAGRELTPTPMPEADAPTMDVSRQPLRIGLSQARGSGWARDEGERLAQRLTTALHRPVVAVVLADYRALVDALTSAAVDVAWMPPAAFAQAERQGCRVLAVASRQGRPTYRSAIIARRDRGLAGLADLRGQPLAWVDRDSASGYLFALAELVRAWGDPSGLGRQHFVGSHRAVCEAIADGWAVAGATYAVVDDDERVVASGWEETLGARGDELAVVGFTRPIPGDNVASRPGLDPATARGLTQALIDLTADELGRGLLRDVFHADALVEARGDLYRDVRETLALVRHLAPGRGQ